MNYVDAALESITISTPIAAILTAAIAPGIALLVYFYLKDIYASEPIVMVLRIFLVGFLIVLPIMAIQHGFVSLWGSHPLSYSFLISAGVEETVKWFVLYYLIYNHIEFDEHYDGILYAVAVSLGFATVENVMYALSNPASFGFLLVRALLPVSGHALFGVLMGYYMGKAKFSKGHLEKRYLCFSLLIPILWHGIYDLIMLTMTNWLWFIVPLMLFLWYFGMGKVKRANLRSPFRLMKAEDDSSNLPS
ncbi:glutamic-type intramembrane protease PrsW [Paenibacillus aquistagni]|uniref:glutamic-type intramembrane protease PrsW n=1 Tax=Paenibacillus aquistagni TaxID=1852522 RepID=UPI000B50522E|nr:glutamic-type intramembrane protease PrsW [Paenibacillus aquistagni]